MTQTPIQLDKIRPKNTVNIREIQGGHVFKEKLQVMGIRVGQNISVVSKQPFRGPLTIKINGRELTLGRGMAKKIMVEVIS